MTPKHTAVFPCVLSSKSSVFIHLFFSQLKKMDFRKQSDFSQVKSLLRTIPVTNMQAYIRRYKAPYPQYTVKPSHRTKSRKVTKSTRMYFYAPYCVPCATYIPIIPPKDRVPYVATLVHHKSHCKLANSLQKSNIIN